MKENVTKGQATMNKLAAWFSIWARDGSSRGWIHGVSRTGCHVCQRRLITELSYYSIRHEVNELSRLRACIR